MRIVHVTDFYLPRLGGLELQVADLAAQQAQRGHDVTVVTSTPSQGAPERGDGVRVVRLTDALRRPHWLHPVAPFRGERALLAGGYDAVHVHLGVGTPLAFWAARATSSAGLPTVATAHSFWWRVHPVFRALDVLGGYRRLPIVWTAVSEAAAGPVRRVVGDPVGVLANGTSVADWTVDPVPRKDDQVVLAAVMRLTRRKRSVPLLQMVERVRARVPATVELRLVLVGDGPDMPRVRRYVEEHDMGGWVELSGRRGRDEIRDLYRRADVFVAPADLESFGVAALEARCAGVPVVAKRDSGVASFVRHGVDGRLAADDDALVDELVELCVQPHLRRELREAPVPEHLDWTTVVDTTLELYLRAGARERRGVAP